MKNRKRYSIFVILVFVSFLLSVSGLLISPAGGVPGTGTSITVKNADSGTASWSYTIIELNPPPGKKPYTASFTIRSGGIYSFGGLRSGFYNVTETSTLPFGYYTTYAVTSNKYNPGPSGTGSEVDIYLASSEGKTVTFTNNAMPAFAMGGLSSPPPGLSINIPPLKPIPVQASLDVDINNDGRLDLVLGKPTVILVNLAGLAEGVPINVSVEFEGKIYSRDVQLPTEPSNIISFYSATNPIVPSIAGNEQITGIYQVSGGAPVALTPTNVTVKDTIGLSLYYAALTKSNYGNPTTFDATMQNSLDFINATYPVKNVTATKASQSIAGSKPGTTRDPYAGMLKDAQAVAQQAQLAMGGSAVGVAIAPNVTGLPDYFTYHGFPGAAGISFGPAVKGVIALDGYWTVPAHEVAHTFGLYYGVPEEYVLPGHPFSASGVCYSTGAWRTGYSFMSVAQLRTTELTWVNTTSTFEYLFNKTRVIPNDPNILLVNGIIYKDGTVEFPLDWVHMQDGTPDTLVPGDYLLKFVKADGTTSYQISFGVSFNWQIDYPGVSMNGEKVTTNEAGFSFAINYPPQEIVKIQVVKSTDPETILATYYMADVKSFSCSASLAGTEGLNDWYVSPVDVTITATADPTAIPPYYVSEIHYKLDGSETTVYSSSTQFTIPDDRIHTLEYWGVDNLRNEGVHHTQEIKIDKTAPTLTKELSGTPGNNDWYTSDVTVTLTGSDATPGSGVDKIQYSFDGSTWYKYTVPFTISSEGTTTLYHKVNDTAGHTYTLPSQEIKIDKTAPTLTKELSGTAGLNGWYTSNVVVTLTGGDTGGSGLASVEYKLNGGDWTAYSAAFTISVEGTNTLEHRVTDNAGNVYVKPSQIIKVDKTAPVTTDSLSGTSGLNDWYTSSVTVTLSASDGAPGVASGVASTIYSFDGSIWTPYTGAFMVGSQGLTTVSFKSIDVAGNVESIKTVSFKIDTVAPKITGLTDKTAEATGPNGAVVSLGTPTVFDVGTPGLTATNDAPAGNLFPLGTTAVTWIAADAAGNVGSAVQKVTVQDTTPPTIIAPASLTVEGNALGGATGVSLGTPVVSDIVWSGSGLTVTNDAPSLFAFGTTTVTWKVTDGSGNFATATQTVTVHYVTSGFLSPIPNSNYNRGRTIPVKFQLKDSKGNFVTTANAQIWVSSDNLNWIAGVSKGTNVGNLFSYDLTSNMYQFNLDTTSLSLGTLYIKATLDDGTTITVSISLT
jgi:hypothetical protein